MGKNSQGDEDDDLDRLTKEAGWEQYLTPDEIIPTNFGIGFVSKVLYFCSTILSFSIIQAIVRSDSWDFLAPSGVLATIGAALILGVGTALGNKSGRAHQAFHQTLRDRQAARINELTLAGKSPPFALYLRAFETTGKMQQEVGHYTMFGGPRLSRDLETALAEAMANSYPMVALGEPGEHFGAGRINTSDKTWRADLERLARVASILVVVPSDRPGTAWELEHLLQWGLLSKCVFFQPPRSQDTVLDANRWAEITAVKPLRIPPYEPDGQVFWLTDEGTLHRSMTLKGLTDPRVLAVYFERRPTSLEGTV